MDIATQPFEEESPEVEEGAWGSLVSLNSSFDSIPLKEKKVSIGRSKTSNVVVEFSLVSGTHCTVWNEKEAKEELVFLEDMSTNGTYVNGEKVGKSNRILLNNGCEITLVKQGKNCPKKISYIFRHFKEEKEQLEEGGPHSKYLLMDVLGCGNFATVKLGVEKKTSLRYAIKIIDKKKFSMQSSSRKNALMDEVDILSRVSHTNIIGIKEVFDTKKTLYLVLELVTGGELFDKIVSEERFSEEKTRKIFQQILDAVDYLHSNGISHRDLKPENILLKAPDDETVKISDFGLSRIIGEGSFMKTMCGTPQYLAPEILTNGNKQGYDHQVDMWSLGVILYILLCGYPPFTEDHGSRSVLEQIKHGIYSFPDDPWATVSESAKDLVSKLLVVDPRRRLTAKQAIEHPFMKGRSSPFQTPSLPEKVKAKADSKKETHNEDNKENRRNPVIKEENQEKKEEKKEDRKDEKKEVKKEEKKEPKKEEKKEEQRDERKEKKGEEKKEANKDTKTNGTKGDAETNDSGENQRTTTTSESKKRDNTGLKRNQKNAEASEDQTSSEEEHEANKDKQMKENQKEDGGDKFKTDGEEDEEDEENGNGSGSDSEQKNKKRKLTEELDEKLPECKYGKKCYRKNPLHFTQFSHPWAKK